MIVTNVWLGCWLFAGRKSELMCAHALLHPHRAKNKQKNEPHVNASTNDDANANANDISGTREKIYLLAVSVCSNYCLCPFEMTKRICIPA